MQKTILILIQLCLLYGLYQLGNLLQKMLAIPIPGSLLGMFLLFSLLYLNWLPIHWIQGGCRFLLQSLPLFFVPVTVGVIEYGYVFQGNGLLLIPAVIISTLLVMAVTGKMLEHFMLRKKRAMDE